MVELGVPIVFTSAGNPNMDGAIACIRVYVVGSVKFA